MLFSFLFVVFHLQVLLCLAEAKHRMSRVSGAVSAWDGLACEMWVGCALVFEMCIQMDRRWRWRFVWSASWLSRHLYLLQLLIGILAAFPCPSSSLYVHGAVKCWLNHRLAVFRCFGIFFLSTFSSFSFSSYVYPHFQYLFQQHSMGMGSLRWSHAS